MTFQTINPNALAAANKEIERLQAEIEHSKRALADLSHEMKTPLNAVIGFAQAMKTEALGPLGTPRYVEYASHIETSGDHLLDLVTTIIDLSKVEAGIRHLKRIESDPALLATQSMEMVRHSIEDSNLTLKAEIDNALPRAWVEPKAVRQILVNLLSNAVKFTSDGSIELRAFQDGSSIIYIVKDTGIGMRQADLDQIGTRFSVMHADGVRGTSGSGLGLALAQELAILHGGTLAFVSAPGEGMTATLNLPIGAPVVNLPSSDGPPPVLQSQLDLIDAYRRERKTKQKNAA